MDTYQKLLPRVQLGGPTLFDPILKECMKIAALNKEQHDSDTYYVLLLLTDGQINDMDQTVKDIVAASQLPLSVVIVGIGHDEFTNMHTLNGETAIAAKS